MTPGLVSFIVNPGYHVRTVKADSPCPKAAPDKPMDTPTAPQISAIIATRDRHGVLGDAIASLRRQNVGSEAFEIIVVDNSTDQARSATFREKYAGVANLHYVLEPRQGLSNARNRGTALARGPIVAFMDDDAIAAPDWIRQILAAFETWGGRAGCVGGRVVPRWIAERPDWLDDGLLGFITVVDWGGQMREIGPSEWISGCNMAFDREALISIGGFSHELGRTGSNNVLLSNEELDAYAKINARGKLAIYAPAAVVEHIIDPSRLTKEWFRRRAAWQAVSDFIQNPHKAERDAPRTLGRLHRLRLDLLNDSKDDPTTFHREINAISCLLLLLLCGNADPALAHSAVSSPWSLLRQQMRRLRRARPTVYPQGKT